jgi:hypothetical protein
MTQLGRKLEKVQAPAQKRAPLESVRTPLAAVLESWDRGETIDLPVLGPAWVRVLGADEAQDVEAEVVQAMDAKKIAFSDGTVITFEAERAKRTLARAVRTTDDHGAMFGTRDEWGRVDTDTLSACWQIYGDVRERLAPLDGPALSDSDRALIHAAWSKKNTTLLRSFGVAVLATYLATTECPPASSPTTTSPPGDLPSES